MIIRTTFLFAFVSLCAAASPDTVAGGPWVVNVGPKTATIGWLTEEGHVQLGTTPTDTQLNSAALRSHKVTYTGLTPGTQYFYAVPEHPELKGSFKTAPTGAASFKFVVYGDTRTRHDMHQRVVTAIVKAGPDFLVHTGDLVADGSDTGQWPTFFSIEHDLLRTTPFYPAQGNHERNNPQFYDYFASSAPYYSFDWGGVHFIILNSDLANVSTSSDRRSDFWGEQLRWLEADLKKAQKADFRFLAFHHPPFTAVSARQQESMQLQELVPIFEKYKVDVVFAGHDHNYQRHIVNGIQYVVTGGGGAPLRTVDKPLEGRTVKFANTEHYVQVVITPQHARIEAVALDGTLIDSVELGATAAAASGQ